MTDIGGKSLVAYLTSRGDAASGMRINIGGSTISFSPDYDPSSLRTDVAGKLVKKLVADGSHLNKGQAYCEIEVMKMFMPLKVSEAGTISWKNNEGAALAPGNLIASLELDNPDNVAKVTIFEGDLAIDGWNATSSNSSLERPHLTLRRALDLLNSGMAGYVLSTNTYQKVMDDLLIAVSSPSLPAYEISEQLSVLSGRIDADLYDALTKMLTNFQLTCSERSHASKPR